MNGRVSATLGARTQVGPSNATNASRFGTLHTGTASIQVKSSGVVQRFGVTAGGSDSHGQGQVGHLLFAGHDRDASFGEELEAEVAATFSPFVVLLCQHGSCPAFGSRAGATYA